MELVDDEDAMRQNSSVSDLFFIFPIELSVNNLSVKSSSSNDSISDQRYTTVAGPKRWIFLGLSVLLVWILFGNLLVLISVIGFRHLRTLSNWVIASLALTDFLLAITVVPLSIYQLVNQSWDLGHEACLFWTGSDVFLSTTSIMHLCAIAIHRHLGIAYPLRMRRGFHNRRHALCLLLPVWTVAAAVSASLVVQGALNRVPVLIIVRQGSTGSNPVQDITSVSYKMACGIYDRTFAIYSSMVSFFVPLAAMIAVDFRSIQILRSGRRRDAHLGGRVVDQVTTATIAPSTVPTPSPTPTTSTSMSVGATRDSTISVTSSTRVFSTSNGNSPTTDNDTCAGFRLDLVGGPCSLMAISASCRLSDITQPASDISECVRPNRFTATSRFGCSLTTDPKPEEGSPTTISARPTGLIGRRRRHVSGVYGRFLSTGCGYGRESVGVNKVSTIGSKVNGRERRAGRTLVWVFVIFVALWLPFFCANLAYGLCGDDHVTPPYEVSGDGRMANSWQPTGSTCYIPEAVITSFTWLGYLSSGVNPLLYTLLNADFQNAFRAILTCGYRSSTDRRLSRSNLFG